MIKKNKKDWLIEGLEDQARLLDIYLDPFRYNTCEKPTDLEVLLLKQPSDRKYVIYRCLWNSGFNPTQNDWVYNSIFLSTHIADKLQLDLKLTIQEIFYILKNEHSFDLLDESGKFKDSELQTLYSQASTILMNLKAVLSKVG